MEHLPQRLVRVPPVEIVTPSLRLRHFVAEEAPLVMALNAEPTTSRWLSSHVYESPEAAARAVAYLIACYTSPGHPAQGPYVLAVEQASTGVLLGHVGFSPLDADVEVSYAIAEHARGRSYGVEALSHACTWVSEAFRLPRLLALTAASNAPSRRTLEKAAFRHVADSTALFQGTVQTVSRYRWQPPTVARNGA